MAETLRVSVAVPGAGARRVTLVRVAIIAVVQGLGTKLAATFTSVSTALN